MQCNAKLLPEPSNAHERCVANNRGSESALFGGESEEYWTVATLVEERKKEKKRSWKRRTACRDLTRLIQGVH